MTYFLYIFETRHTNNKTKESRLEILNRRVILVCAGKFFSDEWEVCCPSRRWEMQLHALLYTTVFFAKKTARGFLKRLFEVFSIYIFAIHCIEYLIKQTYKSNGFNTIFKLRKFSTILQRICNAITYGLCS